MFRWLSRLALLATVALVAWAGYLIAFPPAPESSLVHVEEPQRDLGERPLGPSPLVFRVTNRGDRPIRASGPPGG